MLMRVDCHCHLDHEAFAEDLDVVIERAREAGLKAIIANGANRQANERVLQLAARYDIVQAAIGIYPLDAETIDARSEIAFIKEHAQELVAVGEVGLDYKWGEDPECQKAVFRDILALSEELDLALLIHSRKAETDVIDMCAHSANKKLILHCFSGKRKQVQRARDMGLFFTVPTHVVRSQQAQLLVQDVPLSRVVTETDAPFLSPLQGRNEPANIGYATQKIAELKGMEEQEVCNHLFMNYRRLFG